MKKISIVLISFLLCPVAFAQALGTTKGYYSATQVDSMLWQTLFVATNSFDALGAAHNATNGYPWGSLYDTANAALNATNALGSAAWKSTSFFDLSGAGTTAATAATNAGNIMFTNALPALTNGFVTASITNGLQTTNVNLSQWSGVSTNQYNGTVSNIFLGMSTGVVFTALQPITTATKYTFAHGLSHTPYFFDVQMVCTNQDDATGYLPGAVLQWGDVVKNNLTGQVSCDATNVYLTLTANLNGNWTLISIVPFGGGTAVNMTSSTNWNLRAAAQ